MKPLRIVALAVWVTGTLLACSAARPLYQDDAVTVALIPDATGLRHDHPVQLEVQQIESLFEGVAVERSPGIVASLFFSRQREPAFQPGEIEILAPHVQAALAHAPPTQRVLFTITRRSQVPEETDWELWINHDLLHLFLARHHLIVDRPEGELTATLESGFTRGPGTPRDLPNDLHVLFVPEEYMVSQNPTLTAQLVGTPQTHVVIDYRGYLVDLEKRKQAPRPARGTSAAAPPPGGVAMEPSKAQATQSTRAEPETDAALKERVRTLESQMNDLLGVIKQLSTQLAEVNKTLAAREEEIKALKSGRTRNSKPKSQESR